MIIDVKYLFLYLPAISMSSLEKCLSKSSANFLIFFFFGVVWGLYVLEINPY